MLLTIFTIFRFAESLFEWVFVYNLLSMIQISILDIMFGARKGQQNLAVRNSVQKCYLLCGTRYFGH